MRRLAWLSGLVVVGLFGAAPAPAQTADEVVEKHLAAIGGRQALAKLETRVATGTITISAQGGDLTGPVETYSKAPNKTRTYFRLDLSQYGAGEMVVDQRCDGKAGWVGNSVQGDRDVTGNALENLRNANFPTALLNYKELGARIELVGRDKVGARDVWVVRYTPKAGSPATQSFDAETYLLLRTVVRVDTPEVGGAIEQTNEPSDYRDVDGVKVPFVVKVTNPIQTLAVTISKVEHNKPLDDAMFSKPVAK